MITDLPKLDPITFEHVKEIILSPGQVRRLCLKDHSGIQDKKKNGSITFSVNFQESIKPIYEAITGFELRLNRTYNNYWHPLKKEDVEKVRSMEREQGSRVFIKDTLSISIALEMYSSEGTERHTTDVGNLVYEAKYRGNKDSIRELAKLCAATITSAPYYRAADCICAVPPHSSKREIDVPTEVAAFIANETNIENITDNFSYDGEKPRIKDLALEEKWPALERSKLHYEGPPLNDKKVILVDDLYQSGLTMQFVAMKLQGVGAYHIYGLSMAKTMGDTDNRNYPQSHNTKPSCRAPNI